MQHHLLGRRTALVLLGLLAGCAIDGEPTPPAAPHCVADDLSGSSFIETVGGEFYLDGEVMVPHGINSYPLLQLAGRDRWEQVYDIFDQAIALGRPVIRTNAYMDGGNNPGRIRDSDGSIREEGLQVLDELLFVARDYGIRLLLVLTNNWPDFGGAPFLVDLLDEDLPKDAFWSDPRTIEMHQEYIHTLANRPNELAGTIYADDPTIFAWALANEPRCDDPHWCDDYTLVYWAASMTGALREAGVSQLVAWGGGGHFSKHGENLEWIARDAGVDILTLHCYIENDALPHPSNPLELAIEYGAAIIDSRAELAREFQLPLIVEELGWRREESTTTRETLDYERSLVYDAWLSTAQELGVATIPWMIGETGRPDYDGHLIRPDDAHTKGAIQCPPR